MENSPHKIKEMATKVFFSFLRPLANQPRVSFAVVISQGRHANPNNARYKGDNQRITVVSDNTISRSEIHQGTGARFKILTNR